MSSRAAVPLGRSPREYLDAVVSRARKAGHDIFERAVRAHRRAATWLRALSLRQRLTLAILLGLPFLAVSLVAAQGFYFLYLDKSGLPDLEPLIRLRPLTIGAIEDSRGDVIVQRGREYRGSVAYEDLKPVMLHAILSAEDRRFFEHRGVDYTALPRVVWKTLKRSLTSKEDLGKGLTFPQGGSTITQQLVRVHFLRHLTSHENDEALLRRGPVPRLCAFLLGPTAANKLVRKAEEIRISLWLEKQMRRRYGSKRAAKEQILARYASLVYLGHGRHGFAAASEYYFGKPLSSYTPEDADKAALLAGITKSPEAYALSPGHTAAAIKRRNVVLDCMVRNGFLARDDARRFARAVPVLAEHGAVKTEAPTVVGAVFEELKTLGNGASGDGVVGGHVQVRATVDMRIQEIASQALERGLAAYEARHPRAKGMLQGSVVVLRNRDAAVLAEVGGRKVYESRPAEISDYNRATDAQRQPGSAMKPLVYLAAFRRGFLGLESTVPDEPITVSLRNGKPKLIANYDGLYKGQISVRQALAESRNAVAIWIASQIGIASVLSTAREMGLTTPLEPYVSTALGASEVRLIELANVYRAIASGIAATPHVSDVVWGAGGKPIPLSRPEPRALGAMGDGLRLTQEALRGVVRLPGGTAHALDAKDFPIPVIGKTGTTNDHRDALFVGATYGPDGITVAVWMGFDDNHPLGESETGGSAALPVFRDVMLKAYGQNLVGPVPHLPDELERGIDDYLASAAQLAAAEEWDREVEAWEAPQAAASGESPTSFAPRYDAETSRVPVLGRVPPETPTPPPPDEPEPAAEAPPDPTPVPGPPS